MNVDEVVEIMEERNKKRAEDIAGQIEYEKQQQDINNARNRYWIVQKLTSIILKKYEDVSNLGKNFLIEYPIPYTSYTDDEFVNKKHIIESMKNAGFNVDFKRAYDDSDENSYETKIVIYLDDHRIARPKREVNRDFAEYTLPWTTALFAQYDNFNNPSKFEKVFLYLGVSSKEILRYNKQANAFFKMLEKYYGPDKKDWLKKYLGIYLKYMSSASRIEENEEIIAQKLFDMMTDNFQNMDLTNYRKGLVLQTDEMTSHDIIDERFGSIEKIQDLLEAKLDKIGFDLCYCNFSGSESDRFLAYERPHKDYEFDREGVVKVLRPKKGL